MDKKELDALDALPGERLRELLRQVIEANDGAKAEAGAQLGITSPQVSKIEKGTREGNVKTLVRVIHHMRLDPSFFFDPAADVSDYRTFVRSDEAIAIESTRMWKDFKDWARGKGLSREQLSWIAHAPFRNGVRDAGDLINAARSLLHEPLVEPATIAPSKRAVETARRAGGKSPLDKSP